MKKSIFILGIIATLFTSCNDFIEEDNLSFVSADETYKTASGFQMLVNTNYAWQKGIFHYCSRKGGSTGFGELYRKESRAGVKEAWP